MRKKKLIKNKFSFNKILLLFFLGFSLLTLLFFTYTMYVIRSQVIKTCRLAKEEYQLNCTDSLILLLSDKNKNYQEKNTAIWALGQLSDKEALPTLKGLYTGDLPQKEPWSKKISQYELKKAIKWCEEGNITSWMYRNIDN